MTMENEWIDITDRIPPIAVGVIVKTKFGHEYNVCLRMDGCFQEMGKSKHDTVDSVIAWKIY